MTKTKNQNTPMTTEQYEQLKVLTYSKMFGSNRSAYIRSLIDREWRDYQKSQKKGAK